MSAFVIQFGTVKHRGVLDVDGIVDGLSRLTDLQADGFQVSI
jgi:hypothetical protein